MATKRSLSFREDLNRGPVHDYMGPERFVEEDSAVYLCQNGQVGVALELRGPDYACVDEQDLASITGTWKDAIRMLQSEFEIRQHAIKISNPPIARGTYNHPEVERLAGGRTDQVASAGKDLYAVELFGEILLDCPLTKGKPAILAEHLRNGCQRLRLALASFFQHVKSDIGVKGLDKNGTYNFFRKLVNFDRDKLTPRGYPSEESLGFAACESRIKLIHEDELHRDPYLWVEHTYAKVMALKILPKKTDDNMLSRIFACPCDLRVTSIWRPEAIEKTERTARGRMDTFFSSAKKSKSTGSEIYDEAKLSNGQQLNAMLRDIEQNGERFGHYSLYAVLHGDETSVNASAVEISKVFQSNERDGVFLLDHENQLGGFLATFPGNNVRDYRRQRISLSNYAEMSTIFSIDCGNVRNERLDSECWAVFETKPPQGLFGRTPFYWNPLYGTSQNLVVVGAPGAGKTLFVKATAANAQKYKPFTALFDLKRSFDGLTNRFGGANISFADGAFRGNPLLLPETEENIQFLSQFVAVLIERGGGEMTTEDKEGLNNYIRIMYQQPRETRRLHVLRTMLRLELTDALAPWVEGGQYGRFFDSATDDLVMGDWLNFSFEGMGSFKEAMEPLLFYVLHRVRQVVFDPQQISRLKLLVMDEAWRLVEHPVIRAYLEEAVRTYRDKTGCMVFCSQSLRDVPKELLDYFPSMAVFKHNRVDRELYERDGHLNQAAIKEIEKLRRQGEFLYANPDGARVLQFNASAEELLAYEG